MCVDQSRGRGFRLTWRHLSILALYSVILFNGVIPFFEGTVLNATRSAWRVCILVSPPLLALLVVLIDRAGPVKNWSVSFLLFLFYPAVALNHDAVVLCDYLAGGKLPPLWATLLLNAALIPGSVLYFSKMVPKPCPGCGKRTLIPLMRLFMKDRRTTNTRWCASCGGKFWKDQEGSWRVERRLTWLDRRKEPSTLAVNDQPHAGHLKARGPARRSCDRRAHEPPPK